MNQNLVFNLLIGAVVFAILFITHNPLAILGLFFLQQPQANSVNLQDLLSMQPELDAEEEEQPIGFMAELK